jgi:hypothetical protein
LRGKVKRRRRVGIVLNPRTDGRETWQASIPRYFFERKRKTDEHRKKKITKVKKATEYEWEKGTNEYKRE